MKLLNIYILQLKIVITSANYKYQAMATYKKRFRVKPSDRPNTILCPNFSQCSTSLQLWRKSNKSCNWVHLDLPLNILQLLCVFIIYDICVFEMDILYRVTQDQKPSNNYKLHKKIVLSYRKGKKSCHAR